MLNQTILVGRLVSDPKTNETENERKVCYITLAVPRSYKNTDGIYETDFIPVKLWEAIATNTCEYCHKGDLVGIKGRLQSNENGFELIAEKITFLATNKENRED